MTSVRRSLSVPSKGVQLEPCNSYVEACSLMNSPMLKKDIYIPNSGSDSKVHDIEFRPSHAQKNLDKGCPLGQGVGGSADVELEEGIILSDSVQSETSNPSTTSPSTRSRGNSFSGSPFASIGKNASMGKKRRPRSVSFSEYIFRKGIKDTSRSNCHSKLEEPSGNKTSSFFDIFKKRSKPNIAVR